MANKLNPELVRNIAELTNVKKISDLPIIDVIDKDNETEKIRTSQQFNNSYLLSSTLVEDNSQVGGRYFNYRVKLNEVTEYLSTLSETNLTLFKQTFDFFVDSLKKNTENSYVQFTPVNDTIDTENTDNNYSYTFKYRLSEVLDEVIGFTYNITSEGIEEISTYSYTNVLTEGIVTNATLEKYVRNSIANILGVPSTPAAVTDAIDSVIEFVDWFKGYSKEQDGLNELITKINKKDSEIIASYTNADNVLNLKIDTTNSRIDNLDANATAVEKQYITGFKQENGLITNVTRKQIATSDISGLNTALENAQLNPGRFMKKETINDKTYLSTYIDVDNSNSSLTIGTTEYTLTINNQGKLAFTQYTPITLTNVTSNKSFEYNSGAHTFTVSAKTSKNCTVTDRWENSSAGTTTYSANATISASVTSFGNTSYTLTVKETDSHAATKTVTVNVNYNQYAYWSTVNDTITDNLTTLGLDNETNNKGATSTNGYPSKIYFSQSNWGNGAYIYFLIKGTGSHTFVMGPGTADGTMAGGVVRVGDYTRYGDVHYTLYRSDAIQTGNCNVKIS